MADWAVALVWCVAQVSLLAVLGISGTFWFARRHASFGVAMTNLVTILMFVATLLVLLPLKKRPSPSRAAETIRRDESHAKLLEHEADAKSPILLDLRRLAARIASGTGMHDALQARSRWRVLGVIACLPILVGLSRLYSAARFAFLVQRKAMPIHELRVVRSLETIKQQLGLAADVTLFESTELRSAAAMGWFRPKLVLPSRWCEWTEEQLRAVLAHELAHLRNGDCWWRVMGAILQAIHYYNPLVHILNRQFVLYQELAADRVAAGAIGNQVYLQTLARLALGQEEASYDAKQCLFPVFSGCLIRRITMLQNQEDSRTCLLSRGAHAVALASVLGVGLSALSLRVFAQTTNDEPVARVARSAVRVAAPAPTTLNDASIVGHNKHGMLMLRIGELMQQPVLAGLFQAQIDELIGMQDEWRRITGARKLPKIRPGEVEYIAARPRVTIRHRLDSRERRAQRDHHVWDEFSGCQTSPGVRP